MRLLAFVMLAATACARQLRVGRADYLIDAVVTAEMLLPDPNAFDPIPATVLPTDAIGHDGSNLQAVLDRYAEDDVWTPAFLASVFAAELRS